MALSGARYPTRTCRTRAPARRSGRATRPGTRPRSPGSGARARRRTGSTTATACGSRAVAVLLATVLAAPVTTGGTLLDGDGCATRKSHRVAGLVLGVLVVPEIVARLD